MSELYEATRGGEYCIYRKLQPLNHEECHQQIVPRARKKSIKALCDCRKKSFECQFDLCDETVSNFYEFLPPAKQCPALAHPHPHPWARGLSQHLVLKHIAITRLNYVEIFKQRINTS